TKTQIDNPVHWTPWQEIFTYGIEGLYHFMPDGRVVPFVAVGIGGINYGEGGEYHDIPDYGERFEADRLALDYGAGVKLFLTDNIALRADVRHFLPLNSRFENPHDTHNDLMATVGINLAFGGGKATEEAKVEETPVPAVVVADADHDGVPNDQDMCPDTKAGLAVNEKGCSPDYDSDRDGVSDDRDKCPGNPASVVVNKDGCPPDTDNDGVPDYKDSCKGTPANAKVDANGCAPDSDFDGVPDSLDKCPGTPSGTVVDKNGCVAAAEKKTISMRLKIEFDTDKAVVKKKYHNEIKAVGDFMKEHPDATATIVGHTDNVGNAKKNLTLSKARANSVRQYLIKKFGIKGSRITAIGYGAEKPIASNATKEGRQKNRRIVAVFETK
ncbi:MAG: OmpA family protein, partial [Deltaproteobacteria bacterium]|nr:OmpA family protein [Deltaproteobacteria bacterium]